MQEMIGLDAPAISIAPPLWRIPARKTWNTMKSPEPITGLHSHSFLHPSHIRLFDLVCHFLTSTSAPPFSFAFTLFQPVKPGIP